ncbi:MAG: hypothetical protein MHMPM18_005077 [Marteilia pararefringens]
MQVESRGNGLPQRLYVGEREFPNQIRREVARYLNRNSLLFGAVDPQQILLDNVQIALHPRLLVGEQENCEHDELEHHEDDQHGEKRALQVVQCLLARVEEREQACDFGCRICVHCRQWRAQVHVISAGSSLKLLASPMPRPF